MESSRRAAQIAWYGEAGVQSGTWKGRSNNSIREGRWESFCVNPAPALIQDEEEDTLNEHRDKAGELSGS